MARTEFPRAVRVAAIKAATPEGAALPNCALCRLPAKRFQVDHRVADSHGGKPTLANAQIICEPCWSIKNPQDTKIAAKLKRVEAAHVGAKSAPVRPIKSRGFEPSSKPKRETRAPAAGIPEIMRRYQRGDEP